MIMSVLLSALLIGILITIPGHVYSHVKIVESDI